MIYGACHTPLADIKARVGEIVTPSRVQILDADARPANRRVFIVLGVSALRVHAAELAKFRSTIIVLDAYPLLKALDKIEIIDAPNVDVHEYRWAPSRVEMRKLARELRADRVEPPVIKFINVDIMPNLIAAIKEKGILDKVLTYVHKLQDKSVRAVHNDVLLRYFLGQLSYDTVMRRLLPARKGTGLHSAYLDLVIALAGKHGLAVREVMMAAAPKFDPAVIEHEAQKAGIDPFEVRYLAVQARKRKS